jgi:putative transposase
MLHLVLRREGLVVNHKRTERLYRELRLTLPIRRRKKLVAVARVPLPTATRPNQHWAMDFMQGTLWNHRRFRVWTILDTFTRECPMIVVDTSLTGGRIVRALDELALTRGVPEAITVDNGPEFAGRAMDQWAYRRGVKLDFIRPGKPTENGYIESFNGKLRKECLNQHYFTSLEEAQRLIEGWRMEYNQFRPHSSIGGLTPDAFALQWQSVTTTNTPILSLQTV